MLSKPLVIPQATFAKGFDIKNCDWTVFSSIKTEGTTINTTNSIGQIVSRKNQNRLFLAFTMKFFRIAAEKDGLLIANDDGDHHAEDQDQEDENIARSRISRRNTLNQLYS